MAVNSDAMPEALTLEVVVNGAPMRVPQGTTIAELLRTLDVATETVAVERNRSIARRANHATTALNEGDHLELVGFVGGG